MSKHYSRVPRRADDDDEEEEEVGGFNPRATTSSPSKIDPSSSSSSSSVPGGLTIVETELTTLHTSSILSSSTTSRQDSAQSSINGDETTSLVGGIHTTSDDTSLNHDDPDDSNNDNTDHTSSTSTSSTTATTNVGGLISLDSDPPGPGEITLTLMKLGGTGLGNIRLNVLQTSLVREVIERVYHEDLNSGKRVRLISMGRMLQDNEPLNLIGIQHDQILHVLITDAPPPPAADEDGPPPLIGADQPYAIPIQDGNFFSADGYPGNAQFYSPEQIASMRQAQMQEMARYQRQGTNSEFVIVRTTHTHKHNTKHTTADRVHELTLRRCVYADIVLCFSVCCALCATKGVLLGTFLGVISFIWFINPSVSRKQRLGILVGVAINFIISIRNVEREAAAEQGDSSSSTTTEPTDPVQVTPIKDG